MACLHVLQLAAPVRAALLDRHCQESDDLHCTSCSGIASQHITCQRPIAAPLACFTCDRDRVSSAEMAEPHACHVD